VQNDLSFLGHKARRSTNGNLTSSFGKSVHYVQGDATPTLPSVACPSTIKLSVKERKKEEFRKFGVEMRRELFTVERPRKSCPERSFHGGQTEVVNPSKSLLRPQIEVVVINCQFESQNVICILLTDSARIPRSGISPWPQVVEKSGSQRDAGQQRKKKKDIVRVRVHGESNLFPIWL
jgi:hypothetical protein